MIWSAVDRSDVPSISDRFPINTFNSLIFRKLFLRAIVGWTTDIWVLTANDRPRIIGGVHYHCDEHLPEDLQTTLASIVFTPGGKTQRQQNEWRAFCKTGVLWPHADELILVAQRNGPETDCRDPRLLEHLAKLRDAMVSSVDLHRGRHFRLQQQLGELVDAYITG